MGCREEALETTSSKDLRRQDTVITPPITPVLQSIPVLPSRPPIVSINSNPKISTTTNTSPGKPLPKRYRGQLVHVKLPSQNTKPDLAKPSLEVAIDTDPDADSALPQEQMQPEQPGFLPAVKVC